MRRRGLILQAILFHWICLPLFCADAPKGGHPQRLSFTEDFLPQVVDMLSVAAVAASGGAHAPRYASIALGKNEYVYSLTDKIFIRTIKDRYELPAWQLCGDWASVRISLMGDAMEQTVPEFVWFLAYRDGRWERIFRDDETNGFLRDGHPAQIPPYAVRCFNLDHRDLTDN